MRTTTRLVGLTLAVLTAVAGVTFTGPAAQADVAGRQTALEKSATWPVLRKGDCEQTGGRVVLRPNGTGFFEATTLTYRTHSGDRWRSTLIFHTTDGRKVFETSEMRSPRMSDGNPPPKYYWAWEINFWPGSYNDIDIYKTIQRYSC